jgi:hypothetical protein
LLSEKILDCKPYYASGGEINWKTSGEKEGGIRKWLNHDFLNVENKSGDKYFTACLVLLTFVFIAMTATGGS